MKGNTADTEQSMQRNKHKTAYAMKQQQNTRFNSWMHYLRLYSLQQMVKIICLYHVEIYVLHIPI